MYFDDCTLTLYPQHPVLLTPARMVAPARCLDCLTPVPVKLATLAKIASNPQQVGSINYPFLQSLIPKLENLGEKYYCIKYK